MGLSINRLQAEEPLDEFIDAVLVKKKKSLLNAKLIVDTTLNVFLVNEGKALHFGLTRNDKSIDA